MFFLNSRIFFSQTQKKRKKHKKHVKHDSLLCSYLVLKLSVRLSSSLKLVLGLFKWVGGARFWFFSAEKKGHGNNHQLFNCSDFRIQTQLQICAELYTRVLFLFRTKIL